MALDLILLLDFSSIISFLFNSTSYIVSLALF